MSFSSLSGAAVLFMDHATALADICASPGFYKHLDIVILPALGIPINNSVS